MMGGETWADSRNPKARIISATVEPKKKKKVLHQRRVDDILPKADWVEQDISLKKYLDLSSLD